MFHSCFNQQQGIKKYKCKKILFLGENYRPNIFNTDFSISFDPSSETNFRLPLWQAFLLNKPEKKDIIFGEKPIHNEFNRFAAFTVSNGSNLLRNSHFDQLSKYKKVHAYGKIRMNSFELQQIKHGYWWDNKINFFNKTTHKFMMCYENTSYPWYCTEKILDAFLCGSVPIYYGDPKVNKDWNKEAFINVMSQSDWIDKVIKADKDINIFNKYYDKSVFTPEQKEKHLNNLNNFENWLIDIIKK